MPYTRLTLDEREHLFQLLAEKRGIREIARLMNRSPGTISKESRRIDNCKDKYVPSRAHRRASENAATRKKNKLKIHPCLATLIEYKLTRCRWSPEQIAGWFKIKYNDPSFLISHETIYRYIYNHSDKEKRKFLIHFLRRRKKIRTSRKKSLERRGRIPNLMPIEMRPITAEDRIEIGHWEGDLIVGKDHKSAIGTIVERVTLKVIIIPLGAKKDANSVAHAFSAALNTLPQEMKKTLTYDRGLEMASHEKLTELTGVPVYFAHPHSPWERGTNENTNGLIREFFPKGTDFSAHPIHRYSEVEDLLNSRPRKVLGFKTAEEITRQCLEMAI